MANESLIAATDNQVDLNNNNGAELSKAGVRSDENNGDRRSTGSTGAESGRSPTDECDDLVLKLKRIILQQEQEEKARQQINEKQNHSEPFAGESNDKRQNGSKSPSLARATLENERESPRSVRSYLNGSRSPKSDKRSISQIKKSPVPSRKMINQSSSEINGKLANGRPANNEINQPLIKETVQKIGDLAIDKVSSSENANGNLINGCANANPVKVSVNGEFLLVH